MPALVSAPGSPDSSVWELLPGTITRVGRDRTRCQIVLNDPRVSSLHCTIYVTHDEDVSVVDNNSTNGTWLDGWRLPRDQRTHIDDRGQLRIGPATLVLELRPDPLGRTSDAPIEELFRLQQEEQQVRRAALLAPTIVEPPPASLVRSLSPDAPIEGFVGEHPVMCRLYGELRRVAPRSEAVLLYGETGTGKEAAAAAVHELGARPNAPRITVNCATLTPNLFESEMFGYLPGAFSGATGRKVGLAEAADGGSLFFDEVGELSMEVQARLLRLLQTGEVRPLGATEPTIVSFRLVCATHRDLKAMCAAGTFRHDLYERLAQIVIRLPSLRAHLSDLRELVLHLLARKRDAPRISDAAIAALGRHDWPNNVRELDNALTAACVACTTGEIAVADLLGTGDWAVEKLILEDRALLQEGFDRHCGNVSAQARELGVSRSTLRRKLIEHGIL